MAYSAAQNQVFHERMQRLIAALYEVAFDEGDRLDDIYTNETASGLEDAWVDTDIATASECVEGIVLIRALQTWLTDNGHVVRMSPFIQ